MMLGWAAAAGLGALAATLVADAVLLEPFMMIRLLIYSFAAATIGGLDSPLGALVGGLVVALAQTLVPGYVPFISNDLSLLPVLLVMALVLVVRPTGLFGERRVVRV
jgi:branched-chain amino acid transport system permease protein